MAAFNPTLNDDILRVIQLEEALMRITMSGWRGGERDVLEKSLKGEIQHKYDSITIQVIAHEKAGRVFRL